MIGGAGELHSQVAFPTVPRCVSFSLVFVGRDHVISPQTFCHRASHSIQIDFRIARSQATPRLIVDPFANCILVCGEVARRIDTMDIYVQTSTVTIVTKVFLV